MKLVSFNINSLRARPEQLNAVVKLDPDVIGLQEIKVHSDQWPNELVDHLGYHVYHWGQKSYHGVALFSKQPALNVEYGFPQDSEDEERRLITIDLDDPKLGKIRIINGYFPQGDNINNEIKFPKKVEFYKRLNEYLLSTPKGYQVVIMGDFNISPQDIDIGITEINRLRWLKSGKCSFQPQERLMMQQINNKGFIDSYRYLHPEKVEYSWFDYRSRGFDDNRGLRIDLILISPGLVGHLKEAGINQEIRAMESPSDHCPVYLTLE